MGIEEQKKLTKDIGWGAALKQAHTDVVGKYKTKITNVIEGIKATPDFIRKNIKKKEKKTTVKETDLLKGKDYYPPKP